MSAMSPEQIVALADRLFGAIEAGDVDAVRACYAPDIGVWHNFDDKTQTLEENLATLGWMVGRLGDRHYEISRRDVVADGLWQLHVLRGTIVSTGAPFAMPAAMLLTMADGRITGIAEYLDPLPARALAG
jgi:ketosteroid isomerase-like protein